MFTLPGEGSYSVLERTNVDGQGKTTGAMTSGQEVSLCAYEGMVLEYSL
jgi:hypothetical protein